MTTRAECLRCDDLGRVRAYRAERWFEVGTSEALTGDPLYELPLRFPTALPGAVFPCPVCKDGAEEVADRYWACPDCGCTDVHSEGWIDVNTNEPTGDYHDGDNWCPECESHPSFLCVRPDEQPLTNEGDPDAARAAWEAVKARRFELTQEGEPMSWATMAELWDANPDDLDTLRDIFGLEVGAEASFGGGAAPISRVRRVA